MPRPVSEIDIISDCSMYLQMTGQSIWPLGNTDPIFLFLMVVNLQLFQPKPYPYPSVYCLQLKPHGKSISPRRKGTGSTYNIVFLATWRFRSGNSLSSSLSSKFSYGFSVQAVSSIYPVHLTRYKTFFYSWLNWVPIISSNSYPV